jgi:hypothetical protein
MAPLTRQPSLLGDSYRIGSVFVESGILDRRRGGLLENRRLKGIEVRDRTPPER